MHCIVNVMGGSLYLSDSYGFDPQLTHSLAHTTSSNHIRLPVDLMRRRQMKFDRIQHQGKGCSNKSSLDIQINVDEGKYIWRKT